MLNLSSQPAPSDALTRATRALGAEQLVVAPTETVFGLFALGSSPAAIERLRAARRLLAPSADSAAPSAWHAPTVAAAIAAIGALSPAGERALRRLAPGPVTLVVERNAPEMAALRERLRVAPGVIDDGRAVMVRVSDAEHIAQLAAVGAMVGEGLLAASEPARNIDQARRAITQSGVEVGAVIEEPPPRIGRGSTLVRLPSAGGYVIERQGAMDGAYIHRRMERVVLFLCSGNTCRSPMAQAIATDLASRRVAGDGYATVAQSAGLSAMDGQPPTREGVDAVAQLGIAWPGATRSKHATRDMIARAEAVYVMTGTHLRQALSLDPLARGKVQLLDPSGADIADPIGGPRSEYDALARQMKVLIGQRLDELDAAERRGDGADA